MNNHGHVARTKYEVGWSHPLTWLGSRKGLVFVVGWVQF
jgi:hypothetical protein